MGDRMTKPTLRIDSRGWWWLVAGWMPHGPFMSAVAAYRDLVEVARLSKLSLSGARIYLSAPATIGFAEPCDATSFEPSRPINTH